jgi:DNA modification methylase
MNTQPRLHNHRLSVVDIPVSELKANPNNPRRHSERQIHMLARSIKEFGFNVPVLIDDDNMLITGEARVRAAREIGMTEIPAIRISHLSARERRAFTIADNRLSEKATWDAGQLAVELNFLAKFDLEFDFDSIGFETAEVDIILEAASATPASAADLLPVIDAAKAATSRLGDLWRLGDHRLVCGDARDPAAYDTLLAGDKAMMVITDPPYNVRIDGHVGGAGSVKHREFAMASGEMSASQFQEFLACSLAIAAQYSADGSIHYVFMDWRHVAVLSNAARAIYSELKNICVWNKTNAGMGSLYRSKHEFVFVYKYGKAPHINNIELGQHGRYRTNVWDYAGINTFGRDRDALLALHPTVKPVALIADAIKDCSKCGGIILDPFAGSGTTLIAAEKTGRRAAALEIDPLYVDAAVTRWQAFTSKQAVLEATGRTFDEEAAMRGAEGSQAPATDAAPSSHTHEGVTK